MNDDEIRDRLRALGDEPIDPSTRAAHLRRMAAAGTGFEPRRRGFVWAGIAAAAVVGFLAGSTGLAMADALPDSAQSVAHDVLGAVKVDVPQGKQGKRGPCVAEAAKIKDKDAKQAAKDACPKGGGGHGDESGDATADEHGQDTGDATDAQHGPPASDDPCHGRPPWAGPMSKEQRQAAKASASRENCPKDDEDQSENENEDEREEGAGDADAPATTTAPTEPTQATPQPTTTTTTTTTTATTTTTSTTISTADEPSSGE